MKVSTATRQSELEDDYLFFTSIITWDINITMRNDSNLIFGFICPKEICPFVKPNSCFHVFKLSPSATLVWFFLIVVL